MALPKREPLPINMATNQSYFAVPIDGKSKCEAHNPHYTPVAFANSVRGLVADVFIPYETVSVMSGEHPLNSNKKPFFDWEQLNTWAHCLANLNLLKNLGLIKGKCCILAKNMSQAGLMTDTLKKEMILGIPSAELLKDVTESDLNDTLQVDLGNVMYSRSFKTKGLARLQPLGWLHEQVHNIVDDVITKQNNLPTSSVTTTGLDDKYLELTSRLFSEVLPTPGEKEHLTRLISDYYERQPSELVTTLTEAKLNLYLYERFVNQANNLTPNLIRNIQQEYG